MTDTVNLVGRCLLAAIFLVSGVRKILAFGAVSGRGRFEPDVRPNAFASRLDQGLEPVQS